MATLTLHSQSVLGAPVPRFHVEPRLPAGTLTVIDRSSNERVRVYSPRFAAQFRAGYRAGRWYLRPMTDVGTSPCSPGFRTAREAIAALAQGTGESQTPRNPSAADGTHPFACSGRDPGALCSRIECTPT